MALALAVAASLATAQTTPASPVDTGIELQVIDPTGAVVIGARVSLMHETGKKSVKAKTDDYGRFRTSSLAPGYYVLNVKGPGFQPFRKKVLVRQGEVSRVQVNLLVPGVVD
jgi:carboxypeptidase family protein